MAQFVVRYGVMRFLGVLSARGNDSYMRGDQVIARTPRGLEVGEVLSFADEETVKHLKEAPTGQILRKMTVDDSSEWSHLSQKLTESFETCRQFVNKLDLPMELVDIEQMFGGERLVIYYLSECRVDFRDLVKQLASEFQTRIEMRQIGVRDEAKLLADYGDCGKPLCCNTHLSAMPPVSMKMAKLQKATLDPTKISGRCGRLKCCLRYEFSTYEALKKELPPVGSDVITLEGRGRVLNQEIIAEQLLIQMEDQRRKVIDAADVLSVIQNSSRKERPKQNDSHQQTLDDASP
jgi:cell fate regulator YaaT (PSP1 superfamily)